MLSKKNFPFYAGLFSLLILAVLFARLGQGEGFSVQSFVPSGLIRFGEPIRITFTSDVVSSGDVGKMLEPDKFPISITPELKGSGKWTDSATFVFSPIGIMEATPYIATIKGGLLDVKGAVITGSLKYEFFTEPLEFLSYRQTNFDAEEGYVDYELSFSRRVSTSKIEEFLSVKDSSGAPVRFTLGNRDDLKIARLRVPAGDASPIEIRIGKGLPPEYGTLGLKEDVSLRVERNLGLEVLDSGAQTSYNYAGESSIYINLTSNVDINKAAEFIEVTPKRDIKFDAHSSMLWITGNFKYRDKITVRLKKGLPPMRGPALAKDWVRAFIFPDAEPSIFFQHNGRFLSPASEYAAIPISTINIEKLHIDVKRVYDNNVSYVMLNGWPYNIYDLAEDVSLASYAVDSTPNETVRSAIDLREIIGDTKGLFTITARDPDYWPQASDTVNVTDMAGMLKFSDTGLIAWVNSIALGKPVSGVNVKVYSKSNQILAEGVTGAGGVWTHTRDIEWQGALRPYLAVFTKEKDTSVLLLDAGISQMYSGDFSGVAYPSGAYRVMCYTPRGVFRPGEKVPVFLLLRENNQSIKEPFPVQLKIKTPDGRLWKESTEMLSGMGMASSEFLLSDAARTGAWRAEVYIPGNKECVADASFLVEDFAPPRINVEVSSDKSELAPDEDARLFISSQYLFGSPADGLNYEVKESFIPREYSNPNWPGYVFSDNRISFSSESSALANGTLSPSGDATVEFRAPSLFPPSILDIIFEIGVMQDDGRWVYKTLSTLYYPQKTLFGIRRPEGEISTGVPIPFAFAAVSKNGEALSPEAVFSVFKVETRLITTTDGGNQHTERIKEYIPVEGFEKIALRFEDGKAAADVTFPSYGYYQVTLDGSDGSAALSFWVMDERWRYGDSEAGQPETLLIKLDKNAYNPGDKARARVSGNFDGTVLLSVETYKTLYHEVAVTNGREAEFTWDVTEEMAPNSWVTAHLVRPAASREESWSAHRAFSAVPLYISMAKYALSIDITAPAKLKPKAENDFTLRLTDSAGKAVKGEVTLMLVDDGVLGLTRFETPNPFLYFTKRRALNMFVYDVYDQLIPILRDTLKLLKPGGGSPAEEAMNKANLSPVRAKRFEVLTLYKRVATDNNGNAKFSFILPEFSGKARLMVVGATEKAYGAEEKFFTISDSVVVELSLPRVVAPGDSFESQIMLFNKSGVPLDVDLDVKIVGPLAIAGARTASPDVRKGMAASISLPEMDKVFVIPLLLEAEDEFGVSKISVTARYAGGTTETLTEIPVRPPFPRITEGGMEIVKPNVSQKIQLPGDWMPGTRRANVTMSGLPEIGIAEALDFLIYYPYGCLEQTTSSGWALLSLPDLVSAIDPNLATRSQLAAGLAKRIALIQSLQSYYGSFSMWPGTGESKWASIYATHFLLACEKRGVPVAEQTLSSALNNLRQMISSAPEGDTEIQYGSSLGQMAYASYVISLKDNTPPLAWMSYLKDNISSIPVYGRYFLAAAFARAGEKDAARSILGDGLPAITPQNKPEEEKLNFDSSTRNLALCLLAWNELDPASPNAVNAAFRLLESIKGNKYLTTQELGFALPALADFYAHNYTSGTAILELFAQGSDPLAVTSHDKTISTVIDEGIKDLTVKNSGTGNGYISLVADGVPLKEPQQEDAGMRVRVQYISSDGTPLTDPPSLTQGERIQGKITVEAFSGEVRNIAISLPLAGGLEIENPLLMDSDQYYDYAQHGVVPGTHHEIRDDRLLIFLESVSKSYTWTFSMRAVTVGQFVLPPIYAEGMYSPGIKSIGSTSSITIKKYDYAIVSGKR
ncbi:MAG: hypothetical protein LBS45_11175 [Synergistaceae bacterium]|jgi:uncharacterized protein YfaS (alpha-2-macroglobulin family)|nr:hypothetical protein [Synergistaceae bacterium]